MRRQEFIQQLMAMIPLLAAAQGCGGNDSPIPGEIIGSNYRRGHRLRESKQTKTPVRREYRKVVIVGAGISGLSAGRALHQNDISDFLLLDLESEAGGNARSGKNELSSFPWGAHYVPLPNTSQKEYLRFLEEAGVITGWIEGIPVFNETYLCFSPQERLYLNGKWQEGLIPQFGLPAGDREEVERFLTSMEEFRRARGTDGREAFAIPADWSSRDSAWTRLDQLTMKEWLRTQNFTSSYLHEYVNYCCRDDYGARYDQVSAWSGIHYFASRKGAGNNAQPGDVLTWPEGNGFLATALSAPIASNIRLNQLAMSVKASNDGQLLQVWNAATDEYYEILAEHCILSVPQFVVARLLENKARQLTVREHVSYSPWMVANLQVGLPVERSGLEMCWDNVIAGSSSLGYIDASHQSLARVQHEKMLTYYYPLTELEPAAERERAAATTHAEWCEMILQDLNIIHPNLKNVCRRIDVMVWGHAMARPLPGWIFGNVRRDLQESPWSGLHLAHSDLAGIPIFEEAFYQGHQAGEKVANLINNVV